jgi:hypothetical protein
VKGNREQFLSHKLMANLYNKTVNPRYEIQDDLFSLGMIVLATATQKGPDHFYSWNEKGQPTLTPKRIHNCLKEVQRKYSSRLVKKLKSLVDTVAEQESPSERSALTENLVELEEEMTRVMARARKISEDKRDEGDTIECTPTKK